MLHHCGVEVEGSIAMPYACVACVDSGFAESVVKRYEAQLMMTGWLTRVSAVRSPFGTSVCLWSGAADD